MLAYAAHAPATITRSSSNRTLAIILIGHAAVIGAVLGAKPELIIPPKQNPTVWVDIKEPRRPRPAPETEQKQPATQTSFIDQRPPIIPMEQPTQFTFDTGPTLADIGDVIGSGPTTAIDPPKMPVKIAARWITPPDAVKPPYPGDKLRSEEEATLRLRLTIGASGRVTAVDPVGAADGSFLEAARRHIMRAWRYKAATEDGVAVPSTTVISLSFRLEDV